MILDILITVLGLNRQHQRLRFDDVVHDYRRTTNPPTHHGADTRADNDEEPFPTTDDHWWKQILKQWSVTPYAGTGMAKPFVLEKMGHT